MVSDELQEEFQNAMGRLCDLGIKLAERGLISESLIMAGAMASAARYSQAVKEKKPEEGSDELLKAFSELGK